MTRDWRCQDNRVLIYAEHEHERQALRAEVYRLRDWARLLTEENRRLREEVNLLGVSVED